MKTFRGTYAQRGIHEGETVFPLHARGGPVCFDCARADRHGAHLRVVKDSSGSSIPGATVTALHEQTGIRHTTTTTASGAFVFPSLPIGPYSVICELQGFKRVTRTGNMLDVAADLSLTISMEPGGVEESVTVTARTSSSRTRNPR